MRPLHLEIQTLQQWLVEPAGALELLLQLLLTELQSLRLFFQL